MYQDGPSNRLLKRTAVSTTQVSLLRTTSPFGLPRYDSPCVQLSWQKQDSADCGSCQIIIAANVNPAVDCLTPCHGHAVIGKRTVPLVHLDHSLGSLDVQHQHRQHSRKCVAHRTPAIRVQLPQPRPASRGSDLTIHATTCTIQRRCCIALPIHWQRQASQHMYAHLAGSAYRFAFRVASLRRSVRSCEQLSAHAF